MLHIRLRFTENATSIYPRSSEVLMKSILSRRASGCKRILVPASCFAAAESPTANSQKRFELGRQRFYLYRQGTGSNIMRFGYVLGLLFISNIIFSLY